MCAIIGDNDYVNKAVARRTSRPFVECASHHFKLSVHKIMETDLQLISKVNLIMLKLPTLLLAPSF